MACGSGRAVPGGGRHAALWARRAAALVGGRAAAVVHRRHAARAVHGRAPASAVPGVERRLAAVDGRTAGRLGVH